MRNLEIVLLWLLKVQKENMNYRQRLVISASKFFQKIQICDKHFKMISTITLSVIKIEISRKISKKRGLCKCFGPILGFYTQNSPRNS